MPGQPESTSLETCLQEHKDRYLIGLSNLTRNYRLNLMAQILGHEDHQLIMFICLDCRSINSDISMKPDLYGPNSGKRIKTFLKKRSTK